MRLFLECVPGSKPKGRFGLLLSAIMEDTLTNNYRAIRGNPRTRLLILHASQLNFPRRMDGRTRTDERTDKRISWEATKRAQTSMTRDMFSLSSVSSSTPSSPQSPYPPHVLNAGANCKVAQLVVVTWGSEIKALGFS